MLLSLLLACANDADGDGVVAGLDCDDQDATLGALEDDRDCDGWLTAEDCDDWNPEVNPGADEVFGDDLDNNCDGEVDIESPQCAVEVTVTDPNDTAFEAEVCSTWSWTPSSDGSELTALTATLGDDACRVELDAPALCGPGYYALGEVGRITADGCVAGMSGLDGEGWLRIDSVQVQTDGPGIELLLVGGLGATGDDGWSLTAELELASAQDLIEAPGDDCQVSVGDEDGDGQLDVLYGGTDCDDTDPNTYLGAAEHEDPDACLTDADGDGWGPADCDDEDATVFPGAAAQEPGLCTADADGDGWGDATLNAPADAGSDCNDDNAFEYPGAVAETGGGDWCMRDFDGDGYGDAGAEAPYAAGSDCNDGDKAEFPGAVTEATNNECMRDDDGDGYGDRGAAGLYDAGSDCNDSDAGEFPGAVDEAEDDECMRDDDEDGYGDASATGLYDAGTDCDDGDKTIFPGAASAEPTLCTEDQDGDGWGNADAASPLEPGTDCLDNDGDVYPGAASKEPNVCGVDDDGDGWADGCSPPAGADSGTDCEDGDASIYPGSVAESATLCLRDWDGDGYGTESPSACYDAGTDCWDSNTPSQGSADYYTGAAIHEPSLCTADLDGDGWGGGAHSNGYTDAGTDCDDDDKLTFPGAASNESSLCATDADGDDWGDDSPVSGVDAGTDCDDTDSSIYPDAPGLDVLDGFDQDCDGYDNLNDADDLADWGGVEFTSSQSDNLYLGGLVEVGDWDNDGADDLYVGRSYYNWSSSEQGFILTGPVSSWDTTLENAPTAHEENALGGGFGDIDGDGDTDFALTGYLDSTNGVYGAAWLGPVTGTLDLSNADFTWDRASCSSGGARFGTYGDEDVQFGDLDGDGQDDLVVGSPSHNGVCNGGLGVAWGAVYVTWGPLTADVSLTDADLTLTGSSYPDSFGHWPAVLEDMDGDGVDDLVSGTYRGGALHVLYDVSSKSDGYFSDEADLVVSDFTRGAGTTAGDWDGDGYGDLLVGGEGYGAAIYLGGSSPSSSPAVEIEHTVNNIGDNLAGGGDFDGDGLDDIALHNRNNAVYVFYGGATSGTLDVEDDSDLMLQWSTNEIYFPFVGRPIHFGDFDSDGLDDLAIGTPNVANGSYSPGGVIILPGQ